jgi:hypothetical protein
MTKMKEADLMWGTEVTGTKRTSLLDVPMRSIKNERFRKSRIRSFWRPLASDCVMVDQ